MIAKTVIEKVKRSAIHKAPYNPRTITQARRSKLATSMQQFGMVELLIWNRQSGNLVGGHQRIELLDAENLSHNGGGDYDLDVSVVDLAPDREKALNLALNSHEIGGEFDEGALEKLLDELNGKFDFDLNSLIVAEEKKATKKREKAERPPIDATFEIVIRCTDEAQQETLFARFTQEGLSCRVLTL